MKATISNSSSQNFVPNPIKYHGVKTKRISHGRSHHCVFGDLYTRYRLEKSFFGVDPSVLKSGMQKYARRADVEKALWCLVEMDLFCLLEL